MKTIIAIIALFAVILYMLSTLVRQVWRELKAGQMPKWQGAIVLPTLLLNLGGTVLFYYLTLCQALD